MKKIALNILWILCGIAASIFLIFCLNNYSKFIQNETKAITYTIDISRFGGRISPAEKINFKVPTISVPSSDALKFGSESVLSYGQEGIKIWTPDHSSPGIFRYAEISQRTPWNVIISFSFSNKLITIKETPNGDGAIMFLNATVYLLTILIFVLAYYTLKKIYTTTKSIISTKK